MKLSTFNKLKKMMALTTAELDPEALAALRAANSLLSREGLTWERVLDRSVKVSEYDDGDEPPRPAPPPPDDQPSRELEEAFDALESVEFTNESFGETIASIRKQWGQGRRLSADQRRVVIEAARREAAKADRPRWRR